MFWISPCLSRTRNGCRGFACRGLAAPIVDSPSLTRHHKLSIADSPVADSPITDLSRSRTGRTRAHLSWTRHANPLRCTSYVRRVNYFWLNAAWFHRPNPLQSYRLLPAKLRMASFLVLLDMAIVPDEKRWHYGA
jgi:hypothetical protein